MLGSARMNPWLEHCRQHLYFPPFSLGYARGLRGILTLFVLFALWGPPILFSWFSDGYLYVCFHKKEQSWSRDLTLSSFPCSCLSQARGRRRPKMWQKASWYHRFSLWKWRYAVSQTILLTWGACLLSPGGLNIVFPALNIVQRTQKQPGCYQPENYKKVSSQSSDKFSKIFFGLSLIRYVLTYEYMITMIFSN